jgi:hypothetical protein
MSLDVSIYTTLERIWPFAVAFSVSTSVTISNILLHKHGLITESSIRRKSLQLNFPRATLLSSSSHVYSEAIWTETIPSEYQCKALLPSVAFSPPLYSNDKTLILLAVLLVSYSRDSAAMLDHMTLKECCSLYLESIAVQQRGWRLTDSDRSRIQESASESSSMFRKGRFHRCACG